MTRITPHFTRDEFKCPCGCGSDTIDVELMKALNLARLHFRKPIKITSGFRCRKHNKATPGAAKKSMHMEGKATDFRVKGISARKVNSYLNRMYPDKYGIGLYSNRVHLDVRETKARWVG